MSIGQVVHSNPRQMRQRLGGSGMKSRKTQTDPQITQRHAGTRSEPLDLAGPPALRGLGSGPRPSSPPQGNLMQSPPHRRQTPKWTLSEANNERNTKRRREVDDTLNTSSPPSL
ncbi:unnamed protein product [Boreogadus saida]